MKNLFVDASATRDFFLSIDPDKTVKWTIGAIDSRTVLHIVGKSLGTENVTQPEKFFFQLVDFVRFGLRGVEGLTDQNGNPASIVFEEIEVPYVGKRTVVSDRFLERLPAYVLVEIGNAIKSDNVLTDEDRKKFSGL